MNQQLSLLPQIVHLVSYVGKDKKIRIPSKPTHLTKSDLASYDHIIVAFSGGKDSWACLLHLLDLGVEREKIELWHHLVDGREGSTLMDWAVTESYVLVVDLLLNLPQPANSKGFERWQAHWLSRCGNWDV